MPEAAEPLVDYFDRTYVSGRLRQRPQQQHEDQEKVPPIRIRRTPPAFPPQKWNMHQVTLDDAELQKRLCNLCEDRTSGNKTIAEFLRGVSYNICGGQPNM